MLPVGGIYIYIVCTMLDRLLWLDLYSTDRAGHLRRGRLGSTWSRSRVRHVQTIVYMSMLTRVLPSRGKT